MEIRCGSFQENLQAANKQIAGQPQHGIEVDRLARYDETPRVSMMGLFRLAKTAVFSFSNVPLTMFYLIGAINAFGIAILGEYAARIYDQVRDRPNFLIARTAGFENSLEFDIPNQLQEKKTFAESPEAELLHWIAQNMEFQNERASEMKLKTQKPRITGG